MYPAICHARLAGIAYNLRLRRSGRSSSLSCVLHSTLVSNLAGNIVAFYGQVYVSLFFPSKTRALLLLLLQLSSETKGISERESMSLESSFPLSSPPFAIAEKRGREVKGTRKSKRPMITQETLTQYTWASSQRCPGRKIVLMESSTTAAWYVPYMVLWH